MVAKPGVYTLRETEEEPDTVYKLLKRAGPLLPHANPKGIILYRTRVSLFSSGQQDDVDQILGAFNREMAGAGATLTPQQKAAAVSGSLTKQLTSILGTSEGEAVVVVPPRPLLSGFLQTGIRTA